MKLTSLPTLTAGIFALLTVSASAVEYTTVTGSGTPSWIPFTPLTDDLLQTSLASATPIGNFSNENSGAYTVLYDGSITIKAPNPLYDPQPGLSAVSTGATLTFDLDVSTNTNGYDISQIVGYGGWGDGGRDEQNYSVYYSVVGNSNFTLLGTASIEPVPKRGFFGMAFKCVQMSICRNSIPPDCELWNEIPFNF